MKSHSGNVLIAAPVHKVLTDGLAAMGYTCLVHEKIDQAIAFEIVRDCVGIITSTRLQLNRSLLDAAPDLKWIGRMGSGMEVIDMAYASGRGIACFGSPEGNCNAVGEHALGMLLSLIRRIVWSHNEIHDGIWKREENRGSELEGKTIGIIGFGHTGRAFAKKLQGFDARILAFDKFEQVEVPGYVVNCTDLSQICEEADIVSFHVPYAADTIHYFNESFIQSMCKPFILVNTSRGPVVNTVALHNGIINKKILGACLDVFEEEPLSAMTTENRMALDEMIELKNIVITPHIAGYTHEALYKMSKVLLDKTLQITNI